MGKVSWDYIVPVTLPSDLKGIEPGKLPAHLLKPIAGGGKLHWIAAAAWMAMVEKAKAEGIELKPTSAGDTYREYELQKKGFLQRYQLEPIPGQSTKTFEGKTWYLKKGMAMLATPGKSQHNLGLAVDVHSAAEPKRIQWLIDNVKEFGWSWEVVPSEPWHIRYVNGDKIPAAVAMYMERSGITKPAVSAAPAPAAAAKQTAPAVAQKAAPAAPAAEEPEAKMTKKDIDQIQKALKAKGFFEGEITGVMSPETRNAIKAFKKANGFKIANGIAGGAFLKKLGLK
jgi:hypothetical protein